MKSHLKIHKWFTLLREQFLLMIYLWFEFSRRYLKKIQVLAVAADVRDPESVKAAVDKCESEFGLPNIVINNAAGNFIAPTERLSPNAFRTVVDIVLNGTAIVTLELGKRLIKANQGTDMIQRVSYQNTQTFYSEWPLKPSAWCTHMYHYSCSSLQIYMYQNNSYEKNIISFVYFDSFTGFRGFLPVYYNHLHSQWIRICHTQCFSQNRRGGPHKVNNKV